jgi:hypothetical protein
MEVDDIIQAFGTGPNFTAGVTETLSVTREAGHAIGNGAEGICDIEHVAIGIARVDGNAARVAGASTGSASDQGKVARVAASELGNERVSNQTRF